MIRRVCHVVATVFLCAVCLPAPGQLNATAITHLQQATVRISVAGSGLCSAVFVTPHGHLLTANHGIPEGSREIRVSLMDGSNRVAELMARDVPSDTALLRLRSVATATANSAANSAPASAPAWVPLSPTAPSPGDMLLALGYPAREPSSCPPAIRLGSVLASDPALLRTSCMLTVGDSGGPLLNRQGQLVGLHRQIGAGPEANLHVALQPLKNLLNGAGVEPPLQHPALPPLWSGILQWQPAPEILIQAASSTLELLTEPTATQVLGLGTRLDPRFAATKLSLLKPDQPLYGRFCNGTVQQLQIVRSNPAVDFAVLECQQWQSLPACGTLQMGDALAGEIVVAVAGLGTKNGSCRIVGPGVIARVNHTELPAKLHLGLQLQDLSPSSGGLWVHEAAPGSPAAAAGLHAGDRLLSLNANPILSLPQLTRELQHYQPGDWLTFDFLKSGQKMRTVLQAGHDPGVMFNRLEYLDGRAGAISQRRTGFPDVVQHDIVLEPKECGGLLISSGGRIVGWNVARRARESSLALPLQVLKEELTKAAETAQK
jgi:serine protease Do